eukprot:6214767-Pleurochrysis_carterae.AAC.2
MKNARASSEISNSLESHLLSLITQQLHRHLFCALVDCSDDLFELRTMSLGALESLNIKKTKHGGATIARTCYLM